jgi:hypothetical protein
MSKQSTALRLANALEAWTLGKPTYHRKAAAELRRLHAVNGELLDALKLAWPQLIGHVERTARAAIAKAEGQA